MTQMEKEIIIIIIIIVITKEHQLCLKSQQHSSIFLLFLFSLSLALLYRWVRSASTTAWHHGLAAGSGRLGGGCVGVESTDSNLKSKNKNTNRNKNKNTMVDERQR